MGEIPEEMQKGLKKMDGGESILKDIIPMILMKSIILVISHMPFFFFKFCFPPGPLTIGCCPEAMFFPAQIYSLFTALEKVDKFKQTAKSYPDFLASMGKKDYSEFYYYFCAQGYLTSLNTTLWAICNPESLNYMNMMTFMGLVPGDMPACFWACIQVIHSFNYLGGDFLLDGYN